MDNLTHAVLGASIGTLVAGRRLGRRAALLGAVANNLPDLDVVLGWMHDGMGEWRYHRGATHSLIVTAAVGAALGWWCWRRWGSQPSDRGAWLRLWIVALMAHPLLDLFTSYGTQLAWPLSTHRFAIDAVGIIDPFFTVPLLLGLLVSWLCTPTWRARVSAISLALCMGYLGYGTWLNGATEREAERQLQEQGLPFTRVDAYPTLFQPYLRRVVVRSPPEIRVGLVTLWKPHPIEFVTFRPTRSPAAPLLRQRPEGQLFEWFAMGQTTARTIRLGTGTRVQIEDLRYGALTDLDRGLWGIRADYGHDMKPRGPVRRYRRRARLSRSLDRLWHAAFTRPDPPVREEEEL